MQWSKTPCHHGGPANELDNAMLVTMWQQDNAHHEMIFLAGLLLKFAIRYQQVLP